jgi:hypothetical protein
MTDRRGRRLVIPGVAWAAVAAWMLLLFVLSDQPDPSRTGSGAFRLDLRKLAHLGAYTVLGGLAYLACILSGTRLAAWWAIVLTVGYGLTDELHQLYVPGRSGLLIDVVIDALGGLLGIVLLEVARRSSRSTLGRPNRLDRTP